MNTRLLRMARRDGRGVRSWAAPGLCHAFKAIPPAASAWPGTFQMSWPDTDSAGEVIRRGCRFDWHGRVGFRAVRRVLESLA